MICSAVNRFRLAISSPPSLAQTPHLSRYDWIRFWGAGQSAGRYFVLTQE
jgi:hypothetical protein